MRSRARCTLGAQRREPQGAWWRAGPGPHPPPFRACLLFPHEPTPPYPRRFPFFPFPSPSFHPILVAPSSRRSLTSFSLPPPPCVFSFLTTVTPLEYQFGSPSLFPGFPLPSFRSESRHHRIARHTPPTSTNPNHHLFPIPGPGPRSLQLPIDCSILFSKSFIPSTTWPGHFRRANFPSLPTTATATITTSRSIAP